MNDNSKYLELEYLTLRKEIEDCLTRTFQIMIGGATVLPILSGIADKYKATPIMIALPLVVVIAALMYLNQWTMIMRAGRYIRTRIEPQLAPGGGWEAWLERAGDNQESLVNNRLVDRYIASAFYVLTTGYFFASSWVGFVYARETLHHNLHWVVLGVYIVTAMGMLIVLIARVPTTTTTKEERSAVMTARISLQKDTRTFDTATGVETRISVTEQAEAISMTEEADAE